MFPWICPECGSECASTETACPECHPAPAAAAPSGPAASGPPASVGIQRLSAAVQAASQPIGRASTPAVTSGAGPSALAGTPTSPLAAAPAPVVESAVAVLELAVQEPPAVSPTPVDPARGPARRTPAATPTAAYLAPPPPSAAARPFGVTLPGADEDDIEILATDAFPAYVPKSRGSLAHTLAFEALVETPAPAPAALVPETLAAEPAADFAAFLSDVEGSQRKTEPTVPLAVEAAAEAAPPIALAATTVEESAAPPEVTAAEPLVAESELVVETPAAAEESSVTVDTVQEGPPVPAPVEASIAEATDIVVEVTRPAVLETEVVEGEEWHSVNTVPFAPTVEQLAAEPIAPTTEPVPHSEPEAPVVAEISQPVEAVTVETDTAPETAATPTEIAEQPTGAVSPLELPSNAEPAPSPALAASEPLANTFEPVVVEPMTPGTGHAEVVVAEPIAEVAESVAVQPAAAEVLATPDTQDEPVASPVLVPAEAITVEPDTPQPPSAAEESFEEFLAHSAVATVEPTPAPTPSPAEPQSLVGSPEISPTVPLAEAAATPPAEEAKPIESSAPLTYVPPAELFAQVDPATGLPDPWLNPLSLSPHASPASPFGPAPTSAETPVSGAEQPWPTIVAPAQAVPLRPEPVDSVLREPVVEDLPSDHWSLRPEPSPQGEAKEPAVLMSAPAVAALPPEPAKVMPAVLPVAPAEPPQAATEPVTPAPQKPMSMPMVVLCVACGLIGGFALFDYMTKRFTPSEAGAAAEAVLPTAAMSTKPHPYAKYLEIVGFRINEVAPGKVQVKFIVVNHGAAVLDVFKLDMNVKSAQAKPEDEPICKFAVEVPSLGAHESIEVAPNAPVNTSSAASRIADWKYLRPEYAISAQ